MKLSVAIITYNHERFIAQAIESVLSQKVNFEFEIVIGEDCSTDGTRAVIADFHRRHPERMVTLLQPRNLGAMRNLQETLAACKGQYIAFLEGDDYWTSKDKLQSQVDFLDGHPDCAISCHRARFLNETGTNDVGAFPTLPAGAYNIDDLLGENFVMTCSAVCRWGSLGRLPDWFLNLKLADWPMFALLARNGTIELMDNVMAAYRMHPGGIWSSRSEGSQLQEMIRMLKALKKELRGSHTKAIHGTLARFYRRRGEIAQSTRKRAETGMCLVNCLRYGGAKLPGSRPLLKGFAWYFLLGTWHPMLAKAKRAILARR